MRGGTGSGLASVLETALGGGALTADVVSAGASPAEGGTAGAPGPAHAPGPAAAPTPAPDGPAASAPGGPARSGGPLAFTGSEPWRVAVLAFALLSLGGAVLSAQRTLVLRRP